MLPQEILDFRLSEIASGVFSGKILYIRSSKSILSSFALWLNMDFIFTLLALKVLMVLLSNTQRHA